MDVIRFKPIEGYENYLVSNLGHVYSKKRDKILKNCFGPNGYLILGLWKNNKVKMARVHRLIGLAFIPKIEGKDEIDHIDRNKQNNTLSNLRWVNHSENNRNRADTRMEISFNLTKRPLLIQQLEAKKALEEKRYYCKVCDYTSTNKANLKRHFKTKKHLSRIQTDDDKCFK